MNEKELKKIAAECIADLEDIEFIKLHIGYSYHHFGYGLYLRNKYMSRLNSSSSIFCDEMSRTLYTYIVAGLFSELENDIEKIDALINNWKFSEICTHYYIRTGIMPFEDFPIETYEYVKFTNIYSDEEFDKAYDEWYMVDKENMDKFILPIADSLWNYENIRINAMAKGIQTELIDETYELCKMLLTKYASFLPLEVVYYRKENCSDSYADEILAKHLRFFFKRDNVKKLPGDLFKNREFSKIAVSCDGTILEFFDEFKNDFEVVYTAVENTPYAIEYAADELKNNMDIVELAVSKSEYCLVFSLPVMEKYNDDDRLVKMAIEANGANIAYASERIRDDYEMAELALKNQKDIYPSTAFKSLSARLRNNRTLAFIELERKQHACVRDFSDQLRDSEKIAERILKRDDAEYLMEQMSKRIQEKYKRRLRKNTL